MATNQDTLDRDVINLDFSLAQHILPRLKYYRATEDWTMGEDSVERLELLNLAIDAFQTITDNDCQIDTYTHRVCIGLHAFAEIYPTLWR
jgi:hypothetical protein